MIKNNNFLLFNDSLVLGYYFFCNHKEKISRRNVQVITEKCLKKAFNDSRDKIHTHSLRHTGATILYKSGYDIKLIQEILGHSSVNTTKIYTHLYDKEVEKTMQEHPLAHFKMKNAMEFCAL